MKSDDQDTSTKYLLTESDSNPDPAENIFPHHRGCRRNRLKEISDSELLKQCSDLQISMTVGKSCDIDGHELYEELMCSFVCMIRC